MTLRPDAKGTRLDRALADRLPDHSRSVVARWLEEERVLVNGRAVRGRTKVEGGEQVEIRVPPARPLTVEAEDIPLSIVYEDAHLLVVDKPHGLTVHPGSGQPSGTLANALVHHVATLPGAAGLPEAIGSDRPGIVHRLDKDTSGVIVVAKTDVVQRALSAAFAAREVKKTYLACVHGTPAEDEGVVRLPIGRHPVQRKKMCVEGVAARPATTGWRIEERYPKHTLIRCSPVTGRTHQIRVHMKALHCPIVGDPIYGTRSRHGEESNPRLLLHAWRIAFTHPATGEPVRFEAPLPEDYRQVLATLA